MSNKHRLVTRSDFDGLVCAVLLKKLDLIDEILFVHPKDMQDGKIDITARDITTNLPYVAGAHLAFDHHLSETVRVTGKPKNHIIDANAPSAARVVYDYYGGKAKFPKVSDEMMVAVDKADSAQFSRNEILEPSGWVLLNYLMDARTGLGRFREFRICNYQLMMQLIDACLTLSVDQILATPDVKERVDLYCRPRPQGPAADHPLRHRAQEPRRPRPTPRGPDLRGQPLRHLCALPPVQHLHPRDVGDEEAEHRVRDRQVDPRPKLEDQRRGADARLRRRRAPGRGHLSDRQREG